MSISETFTLVDGVSGPAKSMAAALGKVASAITKIKTSGADIDELITKFESLGKAMGSVGDVKVRISSGTIPTAKGGVGGGEEAAIAKAKAAEDSRIAKAKAAEDSKFAKAKEAEEKLAAKTKVNDEKRAEKESANADKLAAKVKATDEKNLAKKSAADEKSLVKAQESADKISAKAKADNDKKSAKELDDFNKSVAKQSENNAKQEAKASENADKRLAKDANAYAKQEAKFDKIGESKYAKDEAAQAKLLAKDAQAYEKSIQKQSADYAKQEAKISATAEKNFAKQEAADEKKHVKDASAYEKHMAKQAKADEKTASATAKKAESDKAEAEKHVTAELSKQADLEKQIAGFDANRVAQTNKLEQKLKSMNDKALAPKSTHGGLTTTDNDGAVKLSESGTAMAGAAGMVAAAALAMAAATTGLVIAGGKMAIDAGTFREDTLLSFKQMGQSAQEADAMYEKVMDAADAIGLDKEVVVQKMALMMEGGMGAKEALRAVEVIADATQHLGAKAGNKVGVLITKIQASGKIDKSMLGSLKQFGIGEAALYAELAKVTGKSLAEVKTAVATGAIDAKTGIEAVENAIEAKMGGMGEKAGKSLIRSLGDIPDQFARLFDHISTGAGGDALKGALSAISGGLTGAAGEKLKASLNDFYGNLGTMLFGSIGEGAFDGAIEGIASAISAVSVFIKDMTPAFQGFIKGFAAGFKTMAPMIMAPIGALMKFMGLFGDAGTIFEYAGKGIAVAIGMILMFAAVLGSIGAAILFVVGMLATLVAAIYGGIVTAVGVVIDFFANLDKTFTSLGSSIKSGASSAGSSLTTGLGDGISSTASSVWDAIAGMFTSVWDTIAAIPGQMYEAGSNLVNGMVSGITSNASAIADAVVAACGNAIQAAKRILGIASPSKVFHGMGLNVAKGAEQGIDKGAGGVADAAADMADATIDAGSMSSGAPGGARPATGGAGATNGAGGDGAITVSVAAVHVNGGATNEQTAAAVTDGIREGVIQAFRDIGLHRGA